MRKILLIALLLPFAALAQQNTLVGGQVNTGTPSYTNGQQKPLTLKADGSLSVSLSSGGGSSTVTTSPLSVTTTDRSGTITSGGSAQNAIASNGSRKAWCVQNPPTATEILSVRLNGTASATTGVQLVAGSQACSSAGLIDTSAVSVFAATTGHPFTAWEAQ